jgi:ABC-type phosphate/phosphonate transport system substrate-binding protein
MRAFSVATARGLGDDLIAALPMYDLPELREANDELWRALSARLVGLGIAAPPRLDRVTPLDELWRDPRLLLAQTCGYPFVKGLQSTARLIATPRYRARGCDGPFYRSAIVVRRNDSAINLGDLRDRRCAVNDPTSNSGMNLLRAEIAPLAVGGRFFGSVVFTGAHLASAEAVAAELADVAAIDCVSWAHLQRHRPALTDALTVLAWSAASPGLPLVAAKGLPASTYDALANALLEIAQDPALKSARDLLLLEGFNALPLTYYRAALHSEEIAVTQGYAILA